MRADRLLAILMLLQARGRMTARALATELEVSERTIYRDIDALSAAGIPVYGEPGREGGFELLDRYRTDLTGLTEAEVRALSMVSASAPLDALGMGDAFKHALLKLSAALSEGSRHEERRIRQRFYVDAVWWQQDGAGTLLLEVLQGAVWHDRQVIIRYLIPPLAAEVRVTVAPYALVAKAGVWYLVYVLLDVGGGPRAIRVADLTGAQVLDAGFERPADFDLPGFWRAWCAGREADRGLYTVTARIAPRLLPWMSMLLGEHLCGAPGVPDADGWRTVSLTFASLEAARDRILSLGGAVEVLAPRALRLSIADYARQTAAVYVDEPVP